MYELFKRLRTPRTRVMADRHIEILKLLLDSEFVMLDDLIKKTEKDYKGLSNPYKALIRDLNYLIRLEAVKFEKMEENRFRANLEWPTKITETEFCARVKQMPKAKTHSFLN